MKPPRIEDILHPCVRAGHVITVSGTVRNGEVVGPLTSWCRDCRASGQGGQEPSGRPAWMNPDADAQPFTPPPSHRPLGYDRRSRRAP